jgi:hypothetical protein
VRPAWSEFGDAAFGTDACAVSAKILAMPLCGAFNSLVRCSLPQKTTVPTRQMGLNQHCLLRRFVLPGDGFERVMNCELLYSFIATSVRAFRLQRMGGCCRLATSHMESCAGHAGC